MMYRTCLIALCLTATLRAHGGPNALDNTFGPQVVFQKAPPAANTPPSAGYQFFGQVDIDHRSKDMVVALKDIEGATLR